MKKPKDNFFDILEAAKFKPVDEFPTTGFIDTGSYALNALLSASIYGGTPNNRTVMYAGDPSAGKTFFILAGVKEFLDSDPDARVVYYDTEFALDEDAIISRGIDMDRFYLQQPEHWQDFKTKCLNLMAAYEENKKKPPMLLVLDSLGQLPTKKEIEDTASGSDTRDMSKPQIIKSSFRILTQKMGKNAVPMLIANHTYDSMSAYTAKAISGGSGGLYAASTIVMLSKSSDKETDKELKKDVVIGNIIRATTYKSRYTKEKQMVELRLDFETGLDRYYGLLPLASKAGVVKKVGTKWKFLVGYWSTEREKTNRKGEGTGEFEIILFDGKEINDDPEKFWTKEILDLIEASVKYQFGLGKGEKPKTDDDYEAEEADAEGTEDETQE